MHYHAVLDVGALDLDALRARACEDEDSIARSTPGTPIVCWGPRFWIVLRGLLFSCSSVAVLGSHAAFSCSATRLSQDAATTLDIFITVPSQTTAICSCRSYWCLRRTSYLSHSTFGCTSESLRRFRASSSHASPNARVVADLSRCRPHGKNPLTMSCRCSDWPAHLLRTMKGYSSSIHCAIARTHSVPRAPESAVPSPSPSDSFTVSLASSPLPYQYPADPTTFHSGVVSASAPHRITCMGLRLPEASSRSLAGNGRFVYCTSIFMTPSIMCIIFPKPAVEHTIRVGVGFPAARSSSPLPWHHGSAASHNKSIVALRLRSSSTLCSCVTSSPPSSSSTTFGSRSTAPTLSLGIHLASRATLRRQSASSAPHLRVTARLHVGCVSATPSRT
ncbi:hypothetical protein C8R45DRAFT_1209498 [Mycena sanguinolenta]|nr:hypothetical protein C8R45DRAFT_1209498 [Mycena sanguinolenta]